jgi:predicted DNA-binding transcriptional regulator AlpA
MGRDELSWGVMPKPLPRVPHIESAFILRRELLTIVPLSMATIDRLEAVGQFPKRVRLEPTSRVAWLRREVANFLRILAKRKQPTEPKDQQIGGETGKRDDEGTDSN